MQADFSVELGADDPTLAVPWSDHAGRWAYHDLRRDPTLIDQVEEVRDLPGLRQFLLALNSDPSAVETAKCDAWFSSEISPEEEIFGSPAKFVSYVDTLLVDHVGRRSFADHEAFAGNLLELLKKAPEIPGAADLVIRRLHFVGGDGRVEEGFYFTVYVSGFGDDEPQARRFWGIALQLVANAILQLSSARRR